MTQPNPMNLQDRIVDLLLSYGNDPTATVVDAAKAILALVEGKPTSTVYIANGLMNADMTSNSAVTPPDVTFTAPPTVSEQCCGLCYHDIENGVVFAVHQCEDCLCHSPSSGVEPTAPKADWYVCGQCGEGFATHHSCPKRCHHLGRIATKQGSVCRECGEIIPDSTAPVGGLTEYAFCGDKGFYTNTGYECGVFYFKRDVEKYIAQTIKNREREIAEEIDSLVNNNGKHISLESTYDGWRVYNGVDDTGTWYRTFAEARDALINKQ